MYIPIYIYIYEVKQYMCIIYMYICIYIYVVKQYDMIQ